MAVRRRWRFNMKPLENFAPGKSKADYFDDDEPAHPTPE